LVITAYRSRAAFLLAFTDQVCREINVPILLGFILGVAVTIAGAFAFDSATGRAANGLTAASQAPMVNWAVVDGE
jgi:hypothetical protein